MSFVTTELEGVFIYSPTVFKDERGYFFESYNQKVFEHGGFNFNFVQDNQSRSKHGVLRGLHYQLNPNAQTKMVRVLNGSILDVVVDIRPNSKTYKKWISIELSSNNFKQILIPKGFAHGFIVVSDEADVIYKCEGFYDKSSEAGIRFDDPELNIDWGMDKKDIIVSDKDAKLPFFKAAANNF
ncbi:MAG: dTDP-4-dehydrorhamnose 3,5-epimerase [bacterium]